MSYEMSEVVEVRGNYRAAIYLDEAGGDCRPDGDFFGTVLSMDRGRCTNMGGTESGEDFGLDGLWEEYRDWDEIRTVLSTHEDYAHYGVVDLDVVDRQDYTMVNVVTRRDLEIWGWISPQLADFIPITRTGWPTDEDGVPRRPCENNLDEWVAWGDGDVWFYTVEKRVHWVTDEEDLEDRDTWEEVDSCHGFYGDQYAKEAALEALDCYTDVSKTA